MLDRIEARDTFCPFNVLRKMVNAMSKLNRIFQKQFAEEFVLKFVHAGMKYFEESPLENIRNFEWNGIAEIISSLQKLAMRTMPEIEKNKVYF